MKKFTKVLAVVLAVACAVAVAGCSKKEATDKEYVTEKGTLVVGITNFAPMDYKDDSGAWIGFDADFANAFAEKLGVKVEFKEIDWDNKFVELDAKGIDCVWNGMTITDEVTNSSSCTDAYAINNQILVMKSEEIDKYKDTDSIKDLKFAVEVGSAGAAYAEDEELKYDEVAAQTDALLEVKSGSADACIIDSTMASSMTGEGTDYSDLKAGLVLTDEEYGVSFRKGSDLTAELNTFIQENKDGLLKELSDKYKVSLS